MVPLIYESEIKKYTCISLSVQKRKRGGGGREFDEISMYWKWLGKNVEEMSEQEHF